MLLKKNIYLFVHSFMLHVCFFFGEKNLDNTARFNQVMLLKVWSMRCYRQSSTLTNMVMATRKYY